MFSLRKNQGQKDFFLTILIVFDKIETFLKLIGLFMQSKLFKPEATPQHINTSMPVPLTVVENTELEPYEELIRSIPEAERDSVIRELDSNPVVRRAELLCEELTSQKMIGTKLDESRTLFLAALRNLREKKISVAQLSSLHILDSAIRTLYTNPMVYLVHKYVKDDGNLQRLFNIEPMSNLNAMPTSLKRYPYNTLMFPKSGMTESDLPWRMQKPLMQRFFYFTDSEWNLFCAEMSVVSPSEQSFHVLIAPEKGCWSSIISEVQKMLRCMRVLDWLVDTKNGFVTENIMLVPSFSMFQAAINAKARTLGRKPVKLIPTYGYIDDKHYASLKSAGKIAFAMYLPEQSSFMSYKNDTGRFRTVIDGHPAETAFAGAIHDVYHAMREISMTENVARARMRLASIAKTHPQNKLNAESRPVDEILIDGELIHSYPPAVDTMFDPEYRPNNAQIFGDIFLKTSLKNALHEDLKRAFIKDMVVNKELWESRFNINRSDLRPAEQAIFDEIEAQLNSQKDKGISAAQTISRIGLLPSSSPNLSERPDSHLAKAAI